MLYRASKTFDNLCSTFIIYSISEKNWGHEGRVTYLEINTPENDSVPSKDSY